MRPIRDVLLSVVLVAGLQTGCRETPFPAREEGADHALVSVKCLLDWKASMQNAAFYLAESRGYYDAEGLNVAISEGNGAPEATALIGSGTYDIGISSGVATVMGIARGLPVVSTAVMYQRTPTVIYSFAEEGIESPEDLYGKRVGVNYDSINADEYRAFITANGLDEGRIEEVGVSWGSDAILSGAVDALLDYSDNDPVILEVKSGKPVNRLYLADYGVRAYGLNIITNRTFLQKEPETVRRFMAATLRAWMDLINEPRKAAEEFGGIHANRILAADTLSGEIIGDLSSSPDTDRYGLGHQTEDGWQATVETLLSLDLISKPVPVAGVFRNDFLLEKDRLRDD